MRARWLTRDREILDPCHQDRIRPRPGGCDARVRGGRLRVESLQARIRGQRASDERVGDVARLREYRVRGGDESYDYGATQSVAQSVIEHVRCPERCDAAHRACLRAAALARR